MEQMRSALQQIRKLVSLAETAVPDQELLGRFVDHSDEAAFAALVQRHGDMVLGVCRRVLHDAHHADDAWQATFLVLARKAASVRQRQSVGSWLHGVAFHAAANMKRNLARRRAHERLAIGQHTAGAAAESWRDEWYILDEELQRLPERLKMPLVLCYLQGKTQDEAARELGWSTSTLRGRLNRGRRLLRLRLTRRGLTLSTALAATLVSSESGLASLPSSLPATVVKAAVLSARGQAVAGLISPAIITLAEGVVEVMKTKQQIGIVIVMVVSLVTLGVGLTYSQSPGSPAPDVKPLVKQAATVGNSALQVIDGGSNFLQAAGDQVTDLKDLVALTEKDVAIKQAESKVANARKLMATAKLHILKKKAVAARASEEYARAKLDRLSNLAANAAVGRELVDEAKAAFQTALSLREESEEAIALGEAEVAFEVARGEVSQAELEKTQLRLNQLQSRLKAKN
jgi:RNA polymerase sigma factor (sigma-70 family)